MKNKNIQLKTKNLYLIPKTLQELEAALENETDPEMEKAYRDMIQGMEANSKDWLWYTEWTILLKRDKTPIGGVGFKGSVNEKGEVEIGYGINEKYRQKGYGFEAVNGIIEWAFQNENVYYIRAETEEDNKKCFGMSLLDNLALGMCLGMGIGVAIGTSLVQKNKKHLEELKQQRMEEDKDV